MSLKLALNLGEEKQGFIIRLPKFWKQAAQQQQQFYRNSPFYLHERLE